MPINIDAGRAMADLTGMSERIQVAVEIAFEALAAEAETYMRTHAKWTDRTGAARGSLNATIDGLGGSVFELVLAHGVPYGIWLEVANDGRYSILPEAQRWAAGELPDVVVAAVNRAIATGG